MKNYRQEVGNKIKKIRLSKSMSISNIADRSGLTWLSVKNIEKLLKGVKV